MSGLRWTTLTRGTTQLLTWAATLIVMRLLTPTDYGLMAMATIVSTYLTIIGEMGLSVALIQRQDTDLTTKRNVFGFLLVGGLVLFLTTTLLAPFVTRYFSEPRLTPLIFVVAVQFLLIPFTVIPQASLSIAMRFGALGTAGLISATVGALATLSLAYFDFGAYALVIGAVMITFSKAVMLNLFAPFFHRPLLSFHAIRSFAAFSRFVLMERTIWYWYAQIDTIIVGTFFSATRLGIYAVAKQLAIMPFERFAEIMNTVATPAYSSIQKNASKVLDMYLKSLRLVAMIAIPAFWGLGLVAPDLVSLVLGVKWLEAVPLLQLLCVSMPLRTLGSLAPATLTAIGRPDVSLKCIIWAAGIMSCALLAGLNWGLVGVAAGWAIGYPFVFAVNSINVSRALRTTVGSCLRPLAKPLVCAALMVIVTSAVTTFAPLGDSRAVRLSIVTITGGFVYIGIAWIIAQREVRELFKFGRTVIKR